MSDISTERVLLAAVLKNNTYLRNYLQHLKKDYFEDPSEQRILRKIVEHIGKYNTPPDKSTLVVETKNDRGLAENQLEKDIETISDLFSIVPPENIEWLKETTQKFVKERAVYNALQASIAIYQGENTKFKVDAIPDLLLQAINVDFDVHYGLEFFEDVEKRWDYYHTPENRIPFRLKVLNEITKGGVARKTANFLVGGCVHPDTLVKLRFRKRSSLAAPVSGHSQSPPIV